MRIAQISTLATPVRESGGGSIESLVWLLTRELVRLGHEVTVFGAPGSDVPGELVSPLPGTYNENGAPGDWQLCEWMNIAAAVKESGRFDVMHSHAYLWGLPLEPLSSTPLVHTLHITPEEDSEALRKMFPSACVTGISAYQWSMFPSVPPAAIIHHGFDASQFVPQREPGDYVCYLGRFISGKGPRKAIEAARALGLRLVMAGPKNDYFKQHIQPHVDGKTVEYAGWVDGAARAKLLSNARALLYPVQYPEPFGMVLVEAMLCGTPVVAMNLGAVPEIVDQGVTGYHANTWEEFLQAIPKVMALDRLRVREQAAKRFCAERMAVEYTRVYEALIRHKHFA